MFVAVDWLVVRAATRKTESAKMNFQLFTHPPIVDTMNSSWAAMKVAVSHAMPNSAIAAVMPLLNTDSPAMSPRLRLADEDDQDTDREHHELDRGRHVDRDRLPLHLERGTQVGEQAEDHDRDHPEQEDDRRVAARFV